MDQARGIWAWADIMALHIYTRICIHIMAAVQVILITRWADLQCVDWDQWVWAIQWLDPAVMALWVPALDCRLT